MMTITKKDGIISFNFEESQKRFNPYDEDGDYGTYPTFTGLILHNKKDCDLSEIGFAMTIDMDYKGKSDQVGPIVIGWFGSEEEFRKICKKTKINIYETTIT